ncbi:hypothetical protein H4R35_006273 [Dimargaris xerosporica]|nr:hypothetical protein H4R35_006273 [Dimargaris xerosporica]
MAVSRSPTPTLALLVTVFVVLLIAPAAQAVTLTYWVGAREKACFYTTVEKPGQKVGFYFAGQAGGNFDIDYTVKDPKARVLFEGEAQKQGDFVFTGNDVGEYAFCFSNGVATHEDKLIDFDISVENESRPEHDEPGQTAMSNEDKKIDESLNLIASAINRVQRDLRYFHNRENRNKNTVQSTERRVFNFALLESIAIFVVSALQVFAIRTFFSSKQSKF